MNTTFTRKKFMLVLLVLILAGAASMLFPRLGSSLGSYTITTGKNLSIQVNFDGFYKVSNANVIVVSDHKMNKYPLEMGSNGYQYSKMIENEANAQEGKEILVEWTANNKKHIEYLN